MEQQPVARRSNIARPISRLPTARASMTTTNHVHQEETSNKSNIPRSSSASSSSSPTATATATTTPALTKTTTKTTARNAWPPSTKPHGGSSSASNRLSSALPVRGIRAPARIITSANPEPTSQNFDAEPSPVVSSARSTSSGDDSAIISGNICQDLKSEKRKSRPSLSDRTIETLSQVSPAPSPVRRRSSTVISNGSMGPPARPASTVKTSRPATPSTPSSGRAPSPVKRQFRPPGKPPSPAASKGQDSTFSAINAAPRILTKDRASCIGRPTRDDRRSISSSASNRSQEDKPAIKPLTKTGKVKSMYDLRAAAASSRTVTPRLSSSNLRPPTTPKQLTRKSSFHEASPHTGLLKARSPGENVIASCSRSTKHISNATASPLRRPPMAVANQSMTFKKPPVPLANQTQRREPPPIDPLKSSAALRDTIAKAKANRRAVLRESLGASQPDDSWDAINVQQADPIISIGSQSLKKKIQGAVTSGTLNMSAMTLKELPREILKMYDFNEDSGVSWSEAIDLKKLLLADNELEGIADEFFPDWTEEEMLNDPEKSNIFGGLEHLDLHGNMLTQLPVGLKRLQRLAVLNMANNKLNTSVFQSVSALENLRELRISNNNLQGNLPGSIGALSALQSLDLSNNELVTLPASMSKLTNLRILTLNNNNLATTDLQTLRCEGLQELNLSNNALTDSFTQDDLARFANLQILDVSMNALQEICAGDFLLPSLQTLTVNNNRLKNLPDLSNCKSLITIAVAENSLTDINETFYQLPHLRNADFGNNGIRTISAAIVDMNSLTIFNIAGNPLREKKHLTMTIDDIRLDFARRNEAEQEVAVQASIPVQDEIKTTVTASDAATIDDPVTNEASLETAVAVPDMIKPKQGILDMSSKNLSFVDVTKIDLSTTIHTIRLANNDLTMFPADLLQHEKVRWTLKSLDLSHNPLLDPIDYMIHEIHLPVLQSLYIVSTGLTTLDTLTTYLKAPELKELNISCHRLTGHVPWVTAYYPSLTTLLASDNWFDSIDIEGIRGIEILDVRNNEIETLPPRLGLLGNHVNKNEPGKLRSFECSGNRFRVPRLAVIERGTEAILRDLRRMIALDDVPEEWALEV